MNLGGAHAERHPQGRIRESSRIGLRQPRQNDDILWLQHDLCYSRITNAARRKSLTREESAPPPERPCEETAEGLRKVVLSRLVYTLLADIRRMRILQT